MLLAFVPFSHIALEALTKPVEAFLHENDKFVLAQIIVQIPLMESKNLHFTLSLSGKEGKL